MDKKRAIKRLMALGVQRNDAAGFITAYRALEAAGKLPPALAAIDPPRLPMVRTDYQVQKFAAVLHATDHPDLLTPDMRETAAIKRRLARELAQGLLDAGAITITATTLPPIPDWRRRDLCATVEYRATIMVAKEEMT